MKMNRTIPAALIAASIYCTGPVLHAQFTEKSQIESTSKSEKSADARFVHDVVMGNLMEIKLGKLALENGLSDGVRKFGEHLVADHQKANDELTHIAQSKGISVPSALDDRHVKAYDRLAKLNGEKFDKKFLKDMVSDHEKDIRAFKQEASKGADAEIKQFASSYLPKLQKHLAFAKSLHENPQASLPAPAINEPAGADRPGGIEKRNNDARGDENPALRQQP
jgi:putative membrane protein